MAAETSPPFEVESQDSDVPALVTRFEWALRSLFEPSCLALLGMWGVLRMMINVRNNISNELCINVCRWSVTLIWYGSWAAVEEDWF